MKFQVESKEFKKAVDKAFAVVEAKSSFKAFRCVRIVAENDSVVISGMTSEEFADIKLKAFVLEEGDAFVEGTNIVKVYNVPGLINIEVGANGVFSVKNDKKRCEVLTVDISKDPLPKKPEFNFDSEPCFVFTESELLFTMGKLKNFLADKHFNKEIYRGYYFDGKNGRVVSCDTHRLCIKDMDESQHDETSVIIPGTAYETLKKIGNGKSENVVNMYLSDSAKEICFRTEDYTYSTKLFLGDYLNIDSLLSEKQDIKFTISSEELERIGKEYSKARPKDEKEVGMGFTKHDGNLITSIFMKDYQTADILETVRGARNIPDDFRIFLNPQYIYEIAEIFDGKDVTVETRETFSRDKTSYISGMWFSNKDFKCMSLPILATIGVVERTISLVSNF